MVRLPRRRLLSALGLLGLGAAATQRERLEQVSPFSGSVWRSAQANDGTAVESPYGDAEVAYDGFGVPHIEAEDESALYFAAGFVQARDRLFQMDLTRRNMAGELSAVFGERAFETDRFHVKMDFRGAAEASWMALQGTPVEEPLRAFTAGVNRFIDDADSLPIEFELLGYEPGRWSPIATLLVSKQIAWGLTGTFWDLERSVIADALGEAVLEDLYPPEYRHEYPIIRDDIHGDSRFTGDRMEPGHTDAGGFDGTKSMLDWLGSVAVGRREPVGSNNWIVAGRHTANGSPILANDPHLSLSAPPVWYEMHLRSADHDVRGVAFPGVPFVVIGQNRHVAWGFTNVGADVLDCYTYEMRDGGGEYRYGDTWRAVNESTKTVRVSTESGVEEREVAVRKTAHGPLIEEEGQRVGVSWVGLSATREPLAIYRYNHATGLEDFRSGLKVFDIPGQNTVYIDADGNTMYYPAAKYPIRRTDGEVVAGNRVFDGSTPEGEWNGFTPYGESTWDGFIPFDEIPHLINPGYVASANQRVVYGYEFYLGDSQYMGDPYRAREIYQRLEDGIQSGKGIDVDFMRDLQNDRHSVHAEGFVPQIQAATKDMSGTVLNFARRLSGWDREMRADSEAALVYAVWLDHYRDVVYEDEYSAGGLDEDYYPGEDWPLQHLDPDSDWFNDPDQEGKQTRSDAIVEAMKRAVETIQEAGWETYGDYHRLAITHAFDLDFLNYPELPADGSSRTVFNIGDEGDTGSSWRMIASFDGPSYSVIPGGNSGNYLSPHYSDQLSLWLNGEYKRMSFEIPDGTAFRFQEAE